LLDEVGIGAERRFHLRKFSKGMVQRVGIAQALINEPEVIFLDEPMSGLDPLGRREVRELIIRLRDRGCTVFFSSHVLSDAEALCSRVAILAKGRLAAMGSLDELTAFQARGWELVVSGLRDDGLARIKPRAVHVTPLGDGRFSVELPLSTPPEQIIQELVALGTRIVSLNPLRGTLEDFFVEQVRAADDDRMGRAS
jgi:ABC-2 type transport system ATP-binding protein